MSADETYLHELHSSAQAKYTYFLLAAAGSALAFAVQKTSDAVLAWQLLVLAVAALAWCGSFYCGCRQLLMVQAAISANYALVQLKGGTHPEQPNHPQLSQAAQDGTRIAANRNIQRAASYAAWQFRLLIIGALVFLGWHALMIVERSQ